MTLHPRSTYSSVEAARPMRVLDLFSGAAGGWSLGMHRAGFVTVAACEVVEWRRILYAENNPGVHLYDDVRTLTADRIVSDLGYLPDVIVGSPPCFAAGTLVETEGGRKPIEEIVVGDVVLTHKHRLRPVTQTMRRLASETLYVRAQGAPVLQTTGEHPFYARRRRLVWNNSRRSYDRVFSPVEWVAAKDLTRDHFIALPLDPAPSESSPPSETAFWRFVGRWLGDGWANEKRGEVMICDSIDKEGELVEIIAAAGFGIGNRYLNGSVVRFTLYDRNLLARLAPFGHGAGNKTIPGFVHRLPHDQQSALFDGWLSSDGHVAKGRHERAVTKSKSLAIGMARVKRTIERAPVCLYRTKGNGSADIDGRKVKRCDQYEVRYARTFSKFSFVEDGFAWCQVRSTRPGPGAEVFNIGVEGDESYIADGVTVHNCQDISSANTKGKGIGGERSGLYLEATRLVGECRPRWFAFENSANLRTRGADAVLAELEALGYACWPLVVRASDIGANHERARSWLIGCDTEQVGHAAQDGRGPRLPGRRAEPDQRICQSACGDASYPHENREPASSLNGEVANSGTVAGYRQSGSTTHADDGCCSGWPNDGSRPGQMGVCPPDSQPAGRRWPQWSLENLADSIRLDDGLSAWVADTRIATGSGKRTSAASLIVEAFGDAVVPQIPEAIGRAIIRVEAALSAVSASNDIEHREGAR